MSKLSGKTILVTGGTGSKFHIPNKYILEEDHIKLQITKKNGSSFFVLIDSKDYEKVRKIQWYISKQGYARNDNFGPIQNVIMEIPSGRELVVDHINRDTFDNRRSNLRVVTQSINLLNRNKSKTTSNPYVGVVWLKEKNKWRASIEVCGKKYYLGNFSTKEDALKARLNKEQELIGTVVGDNSETRQ